MTQWRGATKLGCLVAVLLLVTAIYFAVPVGEVYLRYYRYRDLMAQEARFADRADDADIKRRLASFADSLGLPSEAGRVTIHRGRGGVEIEAQWSETVELPLLVREFRFAPAVGQAR